MATSHSSCESSDSSVNFSALPIMAMRAKIVDKILQNRVTLIVGETGCGKSSQVPQFLLEENKAPILCTQPRRFAVVAVARMVAKARNSDVGGEVGYHIGHSRVLSERSRIVFKTAGVLLDEMREKGLKALDYKVIILDEVHERSVESDLVLVCVKQFLLRNNDLRVVLMSATADIARYRDYFRDLGRGERVEVLAIPSSSQKVFFQRKVSYLEEVIELLEINSVTSMRYLSGLSPAMANADIKPEVHKLVHDLVLYIHKNELDIEKSILVFLPTYQALERQWYLMKPHMSYFKVHILHRSIDTEQAFMAMKIWKSHRKVILATNIAESSVTIPQVAYVIDSCRSLQVFWDSNRKKDASELTWVSKSQAEQRRGRTGRTCDGQIFRLVTASFFNKLMDYEPPAILRLSLRQQVLQICCAESRSINDPKVLLQKALDPPDPLIVEDALRFLVHINALDKALPRVRYEPTFYGRLLSSFSLSFDASVLILKFGDIGILHEGILLGILMDMQPLPILHPFGQENLFVQYTDYYFLGGHGKTVLNGKREVALIANLSAFQFWQRVFKDKHRLERLKNFIKLDEMGTTHKQLPLTKIEEEWCTLHMLVQSSLNHVFEMYDDVLNSLHQFRPKFLAKSDGIPSYYEPYEFKHTCLITEPDRDADASTADNGQFEPPNETRKCLAVPFVSPNQFQHDTIAEKMALVIKEILVQYSDNSYSNQHTVGSRGIAPPYRFFLNGACNRGNRWPFSHSLPDTEVKGPACKFFFSLQGCRNGDSCSFSHDLGPSVSQFIGSGECLPEDDDADAALLLQLFPNSLGGRVLVLDDTDLHFTINLSHKFNPFKIISTTCWSDNSLSDPSLPAVKIFWGQHDPFKSIISAAGENPIPWNEVDCLLWFPNFESYHGNLEGQESFIQRFFECLAVRILADTLYEMQVVLIMKNTRFSQLRVEKLGRDCFFFLRQSFPFDEASFGVLTDKLTTKKPMVASRATSYVFSLHPPSDLQFGDYATAFNKRLHAIASRRFAAQISS